MANPIGDAGINYTKLLKWIVKQGEYELGQRSVPLMAGEMRLHRIENIPNLVLATILSRLTRIGVTTLSPAGSRQIMDPPMYLEDMNGESRAIETIEDLRVYLTEVWRWTNHFHNVKQQAKEDLRLFLSTMQNDGLPALERYDAAHNITLAWKERQERYGKLLAAGPDTWQFTPYSPLHSPF